MTFESALRPLRALVNLVICALLLVAAGSVSVAPASAQVFTKPLQTKSPAPPKKPRPAPRRETTSAQPAKALPAARPTFTYSDPAQYCQAVGTADSAGNLFTGPNMPGWVEDANVIVHKMARGDSAQKSGIVLRCVNSKLLSCLEIGSASHCRKPYSSNLPTAAIRQYCRENPNSSPPVAITGMTVQIWACSNGHPLVADSMQGIDARGFLASEWRDISAYAPRSAVGDVPGNFMGDWKGIIVGKGFMSNDFIVTVAINGGNLEGQIGKADYFLGVHTSGITLMCSSTLTLKSVTPELIVIEDRVIGVKTIGCPANKTVNVYSRQGRLWVEWQSMSGKKMKTNLEGWLQR